MIKKETTEDGSTTFYNEKYKQCYHSKVGAYTEALEKYVKPCGIEELALKIKSEGNHEILKILDVCFGLGYNSGVAIEKALEVNPEIKIEIIGLENDPEILYQIKNLNVPSSYQEIKKLLENLAIKHEADKSCSEIEYNSGNISIKILLGDARQRINDVKMMNNKKKYDAVFFDPFSPKECPELWQADFIKNVVEKTGLGAVIATYSSARIVKDSFKSAGCELSEGPKVGRRSGGVLARVLT